MLENKQATTKELIHNLQELLTLPKIIEGAEKILEKNGDILIKVNDSEC